MADAFVAVADDATAASWNPAGLVQLERPEISVVGSYNDVIEGFEASWHDEVDSWHHTDNVDLNFASVTYPLPVLIFNRNASVGLYYQQKYDFSREFRLRYNKSQVAGGDGTVQNQFDTTWFEQEGSLSTVTPAFAIELNRRLSLGIAVNFWRSTPLSENGWSQTIHGRSIFQAGTYFGLTQFQKKEEYRDFSGENLTLGVLWNITDKWSVGGRYDSPFSGTADYSLRSTTTQTNLTGDSSQNRLQLDPRKNKEKRTIAFPETIALGVSYRTNDRLTWSCDVTTTDWNHFYYRGKNRNRISLVNADNLDAIWFAPNFDRTFTVRAGAEYVFVPEHPEEELNHLWSLRGGFFRDEEPAKGKPDTFWGAAIGVGLLLNSRVNLDLAYQLRYGHEVNRDFMRGIAGFDEESVQNRVLLSTVIYF